MPAAEAKEKGNFNHLVPTDYGSFCVLNGDRNDKTGETSFDVEDGTKETRLTFYRNNYRDSILKGTTKGRTWEWARADHNQNKNNLTKS